MENFGKYLFLFGRILKSAIQLGCIGHCTCEYVGDLVLCTGRSMEPTLHNNDIVISDHMLRKFRGVKYHDIVVARSVNDPKILVCKRVTALEGDVVLYCSRYVIDHELANLSIFSMEHLKATTVLIKIPSGHVWLVGDNRGNSKDSRDYGPIPIALIKGRVVCRIWPLSSTRLF